MLFDLKPAATERFCQTILCFGAPSIRALAEDLTQATRESGHFAVRSGESVVVIAKTSGGGAFQLTDRVGGVRPRMAPSSARSCLPR